VTYVELAPLFLGVRQELDKFLTLASLDVADFTSEDCRTAFHAWDRHISMRKSASFPKRPIADILIGALACRCDGIITRNPGDFKPWFPKISILDPSRSRK